MNPATALDSAKHFALDPFADIAHHASAGDWNGAGVAYGHAEVGVAQVALAVSGVCEAVMADSCFLPSLADVVDLGEAASGADAAGKDVIPSMEDASRIESHLSQPEFTDPAYGGTGMAPENSAMLCRIECAASAGTPISGADLAFYDHELLESSLMEAGQGAPEAHAAALTTLEHSPFELYAPEVISAYPESFSPGYFDYWGIARH
jgi:hypothetical protein